MKSYFIQSNICSALVTADAISIKQITLVKDDASLKQRCVHESCPPDEFPQKALLDELVRYFSGEPVELEYKCDISSHTELEMRILNIVREIPYSATMTYEEIAERIGNKNLRRAVGRTMGKNNIPIVIPCHRVLGKGGRLTGFSAAGGIRLKEELLRLEGTV